MRRIGLQVAICLACALPAFAHHIKPAATREMPLTTSSVKARDLYQRAMVDFENQQLDRAMIGWRAAANEDPEFALAYTWVAFNSRDPEEAEASRLRAKALAAQVSSGERLMIQWIVNVQEGNFLAGIAAMNDMLAMYPKDKRLLYLAGNWLSLENNDEQSEKLLERALAIDKNYPAALNDIAYIFAHDRRFDKAFGAMERYIALLPNQPNPQDSYAEILRMSGNMDAALEHYRAALKIDPQFVTSQLGLGDTYALMGNQEQARAEYDKAISGAHNPADRLDYCIQKAMTWVREGNHPEADKALTAVAELAHSQALDLEEAEAQRSMAEYAPDDMVALQQLDAADAALGHNPSISRSDWEQEHSRILRHRALRASHIGNSELAEKALQELESMASVSRVATVQSSYHGAAGALLMAKEKYAEAIPHLREDQEDPSSLQLLSRAYSETGATDKMHETEAKLRSLNVPTLEQALIVPAARSRQPQNP